MTETGLGRLLIADRESAGRDALVESLLRAVFRVESAVDGQAAVTALMGSEFQAALRDRSDDVSLLANFFLDAINRAESADKRLSREALAALGRHTWPGVKRPKCFGEAGRRRLVDLPGKGLTPSGSLTGHSGLRPRITLMSTTTIASTSSM